MTTTPHANRENPQASANAAIEGDLRAHFAEIPPNAPADAAPAIGRRLSAELVGDDAIEADMLETILRLGEHHRSKLARDSALVSLAIRALGRAIEDCRREQGKKFPSTADLVQFLAR